MRVKRSDFLLKKTSVPAHNGANLEAFHNRNAIIGLAPAVGPGPAYPFDKGLRSSGSHCAYSETRSSKNGAPFVS